MVIADPHLNPAAVELDTFLPQPPQAVWRALTTPAVLQRWFLKPTGFTPSVGTTFHFTTPDSPTDQITCKVLAARPAELLSYSWLYPHATHSAHYIVTWHLSPEGHGTRLFLTQTGFDPTIPRHRMLRNAADRSWKRLLLPRLAQAILR
ncbi:SRPBCC family protein [Nocardia yunnanensis]|uniref:SRPBCC family protein n=1 Tax=Nocardia yunnanensis TaxID=2382165 RepID=UPI0013C4CC87|nr:SRPBCC domain-containing protein [Nocardia yunnanensis]